MKVNGIPTRTIRALDNGSAIEIRRCCLIDLKNEF